MDLQADEPGRHLGFVVDGVGGFDPVDPRLDLLADRLDAVLIPFARLEGVLGLLVILLGNPTGIERLTVDAAGLLRRDAEGMGSDP